MINKTTVSYLFFGGLTTVVNIVAYSFLITAINMDYKLATIIAWVVSVIFAFFTNKIYVFNSKNLSIILIIKELASFTAFRLFSLVVDIGIMFFLIEILITNEILAKLIANVIVVIMNFFTSKYITFKNSND